MATMMRNEHYYLMDSIGRVYHVSYGKHDSWAHQLLTRLGMSDICTSEECKCLDYLTQKGWRRIGIHHWIVDLWPARVNELQLVALMAWCDLEPSRSIGSLEEEDK